MPRRRLILHIGTEKTGSTTIQHALAEARGRLAAAGILFPLCFGRSNHTFLSEAALDDGVFDNLKADTLAKRRLSEGDFRALMRRDLEKEVEAQTACHTIILSSELIHSRLIRPSEIERLFGLFGHLVDEVRIVGFLRRQDLLAVSRFTSALRTGHTGFDDVLGNIGGHIYFRAPASRRADDFSDYYDYRRLIERFLPFVPESRIFVVPVEPGRPGDLLNAFAALAGIDPALCRPAGELRLNTSMSVAAQLVMAAANAQASVWYRNGLRNQPFLDLHLEIEAALPGPTRQIARAAAEEFLSRFAASNEWVRERFFPRRRALFDADLSGLPETVDYEPLRRGLAPQIAHFTALARELPKREPFRLSFERRWRRFKGSGHAIARRVRQLARLVRHPLLRRA